MLRHILVLGIAMVTVFGGSKHLCLAAEPTSAIVDWKDEESARKALSKLVQWPSADELALPISADDSLSARQRCREWTELVLQPQWIPTDIMARLTAVHRSPEGYDLLVAAYGVDDYRFRIWDTSISIVFEITSPALDQKTANWPAFTKAIMARFLNGTGKQDGKTGVDEFEHCRAYGSDDLAKIRLRYSVPAWEERNSKRYWNYGSPIYWKQSGKIVVEVWKLPDGEHPLHSEFGLKQQFPPVERELARATPEQLIEHILAPDPNDSETKAMARFAERAIWDRPDRLDIVLPLLRSLTRTKGAYARLSGFNTIDSLIRKCTDQSLLKAARELLPKSSVDLKNPDVRQRVDVIRKRINNKLQSIDSESGKSGD